MRGFFVPQQVNAKKAAERKTFQIGRRCDSTRELLSVSSNSPLAASLFVTLYSGNGNLWIVLFLRNETKELFCYLHNYIFLISSLQLSDLEHLTSSWPYGKVVKKNVFQYGFILSASFTWRCQSSLKAARKVAKTNLLWLLGLQGITVRDVTVGAVMFTVVKGRLGIRHDEELLDVSLFKRGIEREK